MALGRLSASPSPSLSTWKSSGGSWSRPPRSAGRRSGCASPADATPAGPSVNAPLRKGGGGALALRARRYQR
eukprot:3840294-Prymnesium_polylepis.1